MIITLQGSVLSVLSTPVTVISPAQLSVAVKSPGAITSAAHSTVTSVGAEGAVGAKVSATVMV